MNNEITFRDIVETLLKGRRMLVLFFLIAVASAFFFYISTPESFTAQATIWPVAGEGTKMADFLAGTGLGMLSNAETKANILLVALGSQTVAENALNKFDVTGLILNKPQKELVSTDRERAAKRLRTEIMRFAVTKNGSIVIFATLKDQNKVAGLVNCYLEELALFLNKNAINMNFTIIDKAQKPLLPSAPNLARNLVISLGIALFSGLLYTAISVNYFKKL